MAKPYPVFFRRILTFFILFAFLCFFSYFLSVLGGSGGTFFYYALSSSAVLAVLLPPLLASPLRRRMTEKHSRRWYRILRACYTVCILFFTVTFLVFWGYVTGTARRTEVPANEGPTVLLVYGCRTKDGEPLRMLRERLDLAYLLLKENPEALAIVSGGVDAGQTESEAAVMARYLERKGIDPARIYAEEDAESTKGNIAGFREILAQERLSGYTLISVSSEFHIPRIALLCRERGIDCSFAGSETHPFSSLLPTMVREYMAYGKMLLLKLF